MKKRITKSSVKNLQKKKIAKRAGMYHQSLYNEMKNTIENDRLGEVLDEIEKLPELNKKAYRIRNRIGVLVEIVGKKGSSKTVGVDYCGGVFYFDGNRLGKRKLAMAKAFIHNTVDTDELNSIYGEFKGHEETTVWKKIQKQSIF